MPISKRDKKVSLTKTKKKGKDFKKQLVSEIQKCVDNYKRIFVISVQNLRNSKLRDVRQQWPESRFFFGKNKVMGVALGSSKDTEYAENIHKVTKILKGQTGLLFTDSSEDDVLSWFENYVVDDYARSGNIAPYTVTIKEGPIPSFCHSIEPQLRDLKLNTSLNKGIVTLLNPHIVCKAGKAVTPEQARILKLFQHKMVKFYVKIEAVWQKPDKFKPLKSKACQKISVDNGKVFTINGEDLNSIEATKETQMDIDREGDEGNIEDD